MTETLDTLWYTRCPVPTGLGIALQKGWLEQAFLAQSTAIRSLRESNDRAVRESHFDHTLQNSVRHGGNIPALWARADGRDTKLIGLSWADETQRILVLPDSDIKTVRDLKRRRFGLPLWRNAQIDFARAQGPRAWRLPAPPRCVDGRGGPSGHVVQRQAQHRHMQTRQQEFHEIRLARPGTLRHAVQHEYGGPARQAGRAVH